MQNKLDKFTKNDLSRIEKTLIENSDESDKNLIKKYDKNDKYYVYMLATKENDTIIPFYIGKGTGIRVFNHENDASKLVDAIKESGGNIDNDAVSEKIKRIVKSNEVYKYIIKWGLTEYEAFMCESSLINMYNGIFPNQLTNIVNGHTSIKEKNSKSHETRMYEISDFLNEVCIEEINYEDTDLVNEKVIFIKIHNALKHYEDDCKNTNQIIDYEEYVYNCSQGYWPFSLNTANKANYVIALQNSIVRGVFPLGEWLHMSDLCKREEAPIYPISSRIGDFNNSMLLHGKIGYFKKNIDDMSPDEQRKLELLKEQLLNKQIKEKDININKKDWFKEQNSIYNFKIINGEPLVKKKLRQK